MDSHRRRRGRRAEDDVIAVTEKTDLQNAGIEWTDREVVVDSGLVTSREPDDIPVFVAKMLEEFSEDRGEERRAS